MADHAALYADPNDPLAIRIVLDHGDTGIYALDLRDEHGDEHGDEIPDSWHVIAELGDTTATGRGTGRARHGRAGSASSSVASGLHASPPTPFTPDGSHQEQGRAT